MHEALFSYYLLNHKLKFPTQKDEIVKSIFNCLKFLNDQFTKISKLCKTQNIEFEPSLLPNLRTILNKIPVTLSQFNEKLYLVLGQEQIEIDKKIALIFLLFGIGHRRGQSPLV